MGWFFVAIAIGAFFGLCQFYLLSRFVTAVTKRGLTPKTILFGLAVFFIAPAALLGIAFLFPEKLHLAAIGMTAALIAGAVIAFLIKTGRKSKGSD